MRKDSAWNLANRVMGFWILFENEKRSFLLLGSKINGGRKVKYWLVIQIHPIIGDASHLIPEYVQILGSAPIRKVQEQLDDPQKIRTICKRYNL
jgi:hypothetical protein